MGTNGRKIGPYSEALKRAIESYEAEIGIKTPELSKRSGIPLSTLRKILTMKSVADFEQTQLIATALGIRASQLMARAEDIADRERLYELDETDEKELD